MDAMSWIILFFFLYGAVSLWFDCNQIWGKLRGK